MARLLFFGPLGDIAGGMSRDINLPEHVTTLTQLMEFIGREDRELAAELTADYIRYIVNQVIVKADTLISDADEIAFLPPVSGG